MDKGHTVPKWVLIFWPKIPQNLPAQFVCLSPKVMDLIEKRLIGRPYIKKSVPVMIYSWKFEFLERITYKEERSRGTVD